jgi:hypothetical protein
MIMLTGKRDAQAFASLLALLDAADASAKTLPIGDTETKAELFDGLSIARVNVLRLQQDYERREAEFPLRALRRVD